MRPTGDERRRERLLAPTSATYPTASAISSTSTRLAGLIRLSPHGSPQPRAPGSTDEKLEDAGAVQRCTGCAPEVSLHVPWDRDRDYGAMRDALAAKGMRVGPVNSITFQEEDSRLGCLAHPDVLVR